MHLALGISSISLLTCNTIPSYPPPCAIWYYYSTVGVLSCSYNVSIGVPTYDLCTTGIFQCATPGCILSNISSIVS